MPIDVRRGNGVVFAALFALLVAAYLVTGSGRFRIVDEVSLFALTESVAQRGALDTNAIAWTQWVNSPGEVLGAFGPAGDVFAKKGPAPAILAVPFYLVGWLIHPLSMLQTAFWFNAVVTALAALLLARLTLALGYSLRTGVFLGLLYGLSTVAWPYATHFFGEPLSTLAILGVLAGLLRFRQTGATRYAAGAGLAAGGMIATSAAHTVLLAPFGIYLLFVLSNQQINGSTDQRINASAHRRIGASAHQRTTRSFAHSFVRPLVAAALPIVVVAALLAGYNYARYGVLFSTGYHFDTGEGFTANWVQGVWGLLFSPYRGFFWYTPLAVASVIAWPGFVRRHRAEGWLLTAVAVILVGLFGKWWMWWGGFAWGPRFLVPLAPLVVLVLASWVEAAFASGASSHCPALTWAFVLLVGLSVIVQLLAVSVNYVNYEIVLRQLYPTDWADSLKYGPPAMFNPLHSPVLGQARLLWEHPAANLDLGWFVGGRPALQVPGLGLLVIGLAGAAWRLATASTSALAARWATAASLAALVLLAVVSAQIYAARPDYGMPGKGYIAALAEIERRAASADGLVTIAPYGYQVPMARFRGRLPIYGYATEPMPLHRETSAVLSRALAQHSRLWLVTVGLPPADPANGVEQWLAERAFKVEDRWLDDARLAAFVAAPRLEPLDVRARLGQGVRLVSAGVSGGTLHSGGTLAVELTWQADEPPGDLRGFVQLLAADGRLVAGNDGIPGGGYLPTIAWQPGTPVADRRGLFLPPALAPGEYRLIAGLYDAATGQRLPVAGSGDAAQGDFVQLGILQVQ